VIVIGVYPAAVTTPFLIMLNYYPVVLPVLNPWETSKIGAPKSTLPVAKA